MLIGPCVKDTRTRGLVASGSSVVPPVLHPFLLSFLIVGELAALILPRLAQWRENTLVIPIERQDGVVLCPGL